MLDQNQFLPESLDSAVEQLEPEQEEYHFGILIPFLAVLGAFLYKVAHNLFGDSDWAWSIVVGNWILDHGFVPKTDVFSWTVSGKAWTAHEWLFCVIMAWLDRTLSFIGVEMLVIIVFLVTAGFMFALVRRLGGGSLAVWAGAAGIFALAYFGAQPRAYIFTFAFIAILMYILRLYRNTPVIYLIPVLFVIWANMHSSFGLGLGILLLETATCSVLEKNHRLWTVFFISMAATLINPYGWGMWEYLLKFMFRPENKQIMEWQAPNLADKIMLILYLSLGAAGMFCSFRSKEAGLKRLDRYALVFWFWVAFVYALTTVRAVNYAILFAIPMLGALPPAGLKEKFRLKTVYLVLAGLIFCGYVLAVTPTRLLLVPKINSCPFAAIDFLNRNPRYQANIFNYYLYGGYLMAYGIRVFIDARADVYIENGVFQDHQSAVHLEKEPGLIMRKYGVRNILIPSESPLDLYLQRCPKWKTVYRDKAAVLFTETQAKVQPSKD